MPRTTALIRQADHASARERLVRSKEPSTVQAAHQVMDKEYAAYHLVLHEYFAGLATVYAVGLARVAYITAASHYVGQRCQAGLVVDGMPLAGV